MEKCVYDTLNFRGCLQQLGDESDVERIMSFNHFVQILQRERTRWQSCMIHLHVRL